MATRKLMGRRPQCVTRVRCQLVFVFLCLSAGPLVFLCRCVWKQVTWGCTSGIESQGRRPTFGGAKFVCLEKRAKSRWGEPGSILPAAILMTVKRSWHSRARQGCEVFPKTGGMGTDVFKNGRESGQIIGFSNDNISPGLAVLEQGFKAVPSGASGASTALLDI